VLNRLFIILCLFSVSSIAIAEQPKSAAANGRQPVNPQLAKQALDNMNLTIKRRCSTQYTDEGINSTRSRVPEAERDYFDISISIRKTAECLCLPTKIKSIDVAKLNIKNENELNASLVHAMQPLVQDCIAETSKQQWLGFCDVLMKPESPDTRQRRTACECMKPAVEKISNTDLIAFSTQAYAEYKLGKKDNKAISPAVAALNKTSNDCMLKAGIKPDSEYKQHYLAQSQYELKVGKARADMRGLASALNLYKLDHFKFPTQQQGLAVLLQQEKLPNKTTTMGPYLRKLPQDVWGHDYGYKLKADGSNFTLISYGQDGKPGGNGFDKDIVFEE